MLKLSPRQAWGTGLICLTGLAVAVWSFRPAPAGALDADRNDAGGVQLLLEADTRDVARQRVEQMEDVLRGELRRGGIPVSQLQASNGEIRFQVDNPAQLDMAAAVARRQIGQVANFGGTDWTVAVADGRQVTVRLTEAGLNDAVRRTMEATRDVISHRISALGRFESTIALREPNRLLVQVPNLQDRAALTRLISRTARLEFRLVEVDALPCNTPRRPGIQYLPSDELVAGACIGVQIRSVLGDQQIADANQAFDETGRVSILVRFDAQGSQRFAQVTQANVGRRFAIVLDNRVLAAPVINEPILGGTASIAGAFTVESANQLAISLRSGRLPVALRVVEERSVGPNVRPQRTQAAND